MKKPFLHALVAAVYIVFIVYAIDTVSSIISGKTILIPMVMLSLFVLSAAIMGFLFFYDPICLYLDDQKQESLVFFGKTVGFFACFVALFLILFFITPN